MGTTRERMLPPGWYPERASDVLNVLRRWQDEEGIVAANAISCVVPHAGWSFSGRLAFATLSRLDNRAETIVIVGGHLPATGALLVAGQDSFATPIGTLNSDLHVIQLLEGRLSLDHDSQPDNTVEVQLPMVKFLFPSASVVWLRAPPAEGALRLGEMLAEIALELGISMAVVGSTDLTHYGPAYGFTPFGRGQHAVGRVRNENDRVFLDHLLSMKPGDAIAHAGANRSACSAGAAAAALAFAAALGIDEGNLIGHQLSCDTVASESFVGYGGVTYLKA